MVRTGTGGWTSQGWAAYEHLPGVAAAELSPTPWSALRDAADAFHTAVASLERPSFLDHRDDAWARADRAAWGDEDITVDQRARTIVDRLRAGLAPIGDPQLIHGDLTGNVLIADDGDPVVLDLSPYWRPTEYAIGIVAADALCRGDRAPDVLHQLPVEPAAVARGLLFRLFTSAQQPMSDVGVAPFLAATVSIGL